MKTEVLRQYDKTALALAEHGMACLRIPTVYLWGGIGEMITEEVIEKMKGAYPKIYNDEYCEKLRELIGHNVRGFDCSGLIKNFLMGGLEAYEYDAEQDMNSYMMLEASEYSGTIDLLPEKQGICLFMPGHVGIYVGAGRVIEATMNENYGNGVVETTLRDREWTNWFCCPGVIYDE